MCVELCDVTDGGEYANCQDCGRAICFDAPVDAVDVLDRAYVTASGDLYCTRCGRKYDQAEEEELDEGYGDGVLDFEEDCL